MKCASIKRQYGIWIIKTIGKVTGKIVPNAFKLFSLVKTSWWDVHLQLLARYEADSDSSLCNTHVAHGGGKAKGSMEQADKFPS